MTASAHIAFIQPKPWISFWTIGAKTNCPKEPPALMTPEAVPRASIGRRCAAAPISTEKLLDPEPIAVSRPMAKIIPRPDVMNGVSALPMAMIKRPPISTGRGP